MASVDLSAAAPESPAFKFWDNNAAPTPIQGATAADSVTVRRPTLLKVTGLDGTTVVRVDVKVHPDDTFQEFTTLDGAVDTEFIVEFLQPYNFLKLTRTAGSADPLAFAQFGNVGHGAL